MSLYSPGQGGGLGQSPADFYRNAPNLLRKGGPFSDGQEDEDSLRTRLVSNSFYNKAAEEAAGIHGQVQYAPRYPSQLASAGNRGSALAGGLVEAFKPLIGGIAGGITNALAPRFAGSNPAVSSLLPGAGAAVNFNLPAADFTMPWPFGS